MAGHDELFLLREHNRAHTEESEEQCNNRDIFNHLQSSAYGYIYIIYIYIYTYSIDSFPMSFHWSRFELQICLCSQPMGQIPFGLPHWVVTERPPGPGNSRISSKGSFNKKENRERFSRANFSLSQHFLIHLTTSYSSLGPPVHNRCPTSSNDGLSVAMNANNSAMIF